LAALLESPTNVQKRRFRVGRLQIMCWQPSHQNLISLVPRRAKHTVVLLTTLGLFLKIYGRFKRNRHFGSIARIPHNAQHKCSKTKLSRGTSETDVLAAFTSTLHFVRPLPSETHFSGFDKLGTVFLNLRTP
jgi:hypothetical protein